ncbi:MAG: Peptidase LD-carboxypeptidase [Pedosphaera sp.]|nr:Peptidase LD-carboxypeptidase [Pedosphaera sp.]
MPTLPKRLHTGDTIGLIAPASAPPDPKTIDRSIAALEEMGFRVKLGRNVRKRWGYLAGTDRERAEDLMKMFGDKKVNGIICARGGYGTARLLPLLDYGVIRTGAKVFVGFSDITSLHCAFLKKCGLVSFHGPMTSASLIEEDYPEFSQRSLLKAITDANPGGSICAGYTEKTVSILRGGKVSGELIGGNLSLLCTLIGTAFQPSFRGKILFFEDVDEKPYRFDRMLTHLANAGLLQQVAGIAVGVCHNCEDPKAKDAGEYRQTLEDVLKERLLPLKIPVVSGLPFGHVRFNATLPVGGRAMLDADAGDLILTSAATHS